MAKHESHWLDKRGRPATKSRRPYPYLENITFFGRYLKTSLQSQKTGNYIIFGAAVMVDGNIT